MSSNDSGTTTNVERRSDRELVVTRSFDAPARLVYAAWSQADLFRTWWVPRSLGMTLLSCTMDVRTGGGYRLEFAVDGAEPMAFFGTYTDVIPGERIVWTNEEGPDGAVTTVTFSETDGRTLVTYSELYPTKAAFEEGQSAMVDGMREQFAQLDELLAGEAVR
ncbi:SRPBCC domain-containing protein [Sandarakinorhabdus sp. DWP1-3-1]|uniref:SRPBCC domain-containing protein n=1 Tax=Sandarakinorhabdus sp. DWP1-3-1 TaxID=2804627 RepID=UPI003CF071C5